MWNEIEESRLFPIRYEPPLRQPEEEPEEEELEIDDVLQK